MPPDRTARKKLPRLDGLKVRIVDDPTPTGAELGRALRTLARLMVRSQQVQGDHQAIDAASPSSSTLTLSPNSRPDHLDDAA